MYRRIKKMFEEYANKIGAIIAIILGIAAVIILIGCIVAGLIFVINESKENRKAKKEFLGKKYFKSATNCIKLTDEEIKQTFDFAETFQNFCQRYGLKGSKSSLNLFINSALRTYKYSEESNKKEK